MNSLLRISIVLTIASLSQSFLLAPKNPQTTTLFAKKAGKAKARTSSAGGFGNVEEKVQDDYAVFPKLEVRVQETLVPSLDTAMSGEIYGRLAQIYGFPDFNYEQQDATESLNSLLLSDSKTNTIDGLFADTDKSTKASDRLGLSQIPPFEEFEVLHVDPLVLSIKNFFSEEECERYVSMSSSKQDAMESRSPTVGKDAAAKAQRTSTTWYHHFENVPELMAKATRLMGLDTISRWEEPQTVRYRRNEKFTWHLDALGPAENKPESGGQRIATLLVYLTELDSKEGGATIFRDLGREGDYLRVQPEKGSALLFFPAAGGIPGSPFDIRTLHCGEAVSKSSEHDKWIAQLWLRETPYSPTAPPNNSHEAASSNIQEYSNGWQ